MKITGFNANSSFIKVKSPKLPFALLFIVAFLAVVPAVSADSASAEPITGSIKLLAMSEVREGQYRGSLADLALEIRPGKGRIFVSTYPISKIDTQISMRFAKQIACKYSVVDCSRYDFVYTLKADSGIVGGPSAGAAAAVLTASLLSDLSLRRDIAITGTINSGELIGSVGGIKAKIEAALDAGIKKVLIPKGESIHREEEGNATINLIEYGDDLGIEVIEVSTLNDAMFYFTGKKVEEINAELVVDPEYTRIMKSLAVMLCNKTSLLEQDYFDVRPEKINNDTIAKREESALNSTRKAEKAFELGDYYTSASFCFRANIEYSHLSYYFQNLSEEEVNKKIEELEGEIDDFEDDIEARKLETLTDLQAYMVTKERIGESRDRISQLAEALEDGKWNNIAYLLAFAEERLYSARSWSKFFGAEGQKFDLDEESLKESCEVKISEAEESYQYVVFYFPAMLSDTRKEIDSAKLEHKRGNYITCLFEASRAKANANLVLSMIGVEENMLSELLSNKIAAAERVIVGQQDMGIFPIMGYSYFEYANSLAEEDAASGIIYAEYALELSNFDFYFEETKAIDFSKIRIEYNPFIVLAIGIVIGFLIGSKVGKIRAKKEHNQGAKSTKKPKPKKKR